MEEQFVLEIQKTNEKKETILLTNTRIHYEFRPTDPILENTCLYDFVANFEITKKFKKNDTNTDDVNTTKSKVKLERYELNSTHPLKTTHELKSKAHKIPVLIGPQIPRQDRNDSKERYCRAILTLFHPWRSLDDLCTTDQNWEEALNERLININENSKKKIQNIQLLHTCKEIRNTQLSHSLQTDLSVQTNAEKLERLYLQDNDENDVQWEKSFLDFLEFNVSNNFTKNSHAMDQYILNANTAAAKALKFKYSTSKYYYYYTVSSLKT